MSREEFVFSKKAIVVVSVISVIGSNIVVGFLAAMWLWNFSARMQAEVTDSATRAATIAIEASLRPALDKQIAHEASDEKTEGRLDARMDAMSERIKALEDRLNAQRR